jgi:hypothetical protein
MPDEDPEAGEPDEAHEVAGFGLIAGVDATMAQEPGDEPLDVPPPSIATEGAAVLGLGVSRMVRSDELDAASTKLSVERIAVVGLVADQEPRERFREAGVDGLDDELLLISRTTRNPCGDRKTKAV